ncbi:MAG TPA: NAD(P)-dependent oxidoreductase [Myxococcota bacterium]|nr:NAD(P)-dependent oxidoreductase [Myxococcota bacterium]
MALRAGFIGLGNQGKPIALNLVAAGFPTTVFDLAAGPLAELSAAGAKAAASSREVAERSDVICLCVPEDRHVREVMAGGQGVLVGAVRGTVVAIHSTILPDTAIALAAEAAPRGVEVLDACVTGGAARAAQKQLTFLVGGSPQALERARPLFEASGSAVIHAGALGNGAKLKLCLNLITYLQWAAAFESFALARAVGLPQELLEEAGRANGQLTPLMQAFLALHKAPESARKSDGMQALLRGHMLLAEKDLAWALELARRAGVSLPVGGVVAQQMARIYGVADEGRR